MIDEDIEPEEGNLDVLRSNEDCLSHILCRCLCHISNEERHYDRCCRMCQYCGKNVVIYEDEND